MSAIDQAGFVDPAGVESEVRESGGSAARLRIALCYLFRHQRPLSLSNPQRFTELVQRRKIANRDQRMAMLSDKLLAKEHVATLLGEEWLIPTLWQGRELPAAPRWPLPFVLKSRHGCNQNLFFRDDSDDWIAARTRGRRWVRQAYGQWLDEWLYSQIERGLLIEPFIGSDGELPVDYKIYVFGGNATHVQVHLGRERRHRWILFDRDWRRVSKPTTEPDPPPPASLSEMMAAAEALGQGFDFLRVDMYEPGGRPLFGEMTFYPGSGLDKFHPTSLDAVLGRLWFAAGGR